MFIIYTIACQKIQGDWGDGAELVRVPLALLWHMNINALKYEDKRMMRIKNSNNNYSKNNKNNKKNFNWLFIYYFVYKLLKYQK